MARVEYIQPEDADGATHELYEAIETTIGRVSNFMRIMGNTPHFLRWTFPLGIAAQRDGFSTIPFRLRNLAIVKTSLVNSCHY